MKVVNFKKQCMFVTSGLESGDACSKIIHIHHIKPLRYGGTDDSENLIYLCACHHRNIHQMYSGQAQAQLNHENDQWFKYLLGSIGLLPDEMLQEAR